MVSSHNKILSHPDRDEIINKLLNFTTPADIAESLKARYCNEGEDKFHLSEKAIAKFQKDYLDIYEVVKADLVKTKQNLLAPEDAKQEIQGTAGYHKALETYATKELDIKTILQKAVTNIENRAAIVFDNIMADPENMKFDRTLIEWLNLLTEACLKANEVINGSPEQISIQNNINIQIVDKHINTIFNIIREILSKLDFETSQLFIEMFNEEMAKIKDDANLAPVETRLQEARVLSEKVINKTEQ